MEEASGEPGSTHGPVTSAAERDTAKLQSTPQAAAAGAEVLTPEQAAALIEASMDTVHGHLDAHHVQVSSDPAGRILITVSLSLAQDGSETPPPADADQVVQLVVQLKAARQRLDEAATREMRLQEELEAAETALEYTKAEVANLWRVMTTRNLRKAARQASQEARDNERVVSLAEQRARIRTKVNDVRAMARRRKWPWGLVV